MAQERAPYSAGYDYKYAISEKGRETLRRYRATPKGKAVMAASAVKSRLANPEKHHARWAVKDAIRAGHLVRQPCEVCGEKAQAHHEDYSRPLDVRWLCHAHHNAAHDRVAHMEVA